MDPWKFLLRLWALLTLVSLAVDGACVWIDAHGGTVPPLEAWGVNHVTLFLWSVPAPFVLAILLPILGVCLGLIGRMARLSVPRRPLLTAQTRRRHGAAARRDAA